MQDVLKRWQDYRGNLESTERFLKEEFPHWLKETDNDVPDSMTDAERKLDGVKVNGPQRDNPCLWGLDKAGLKPVSSAPETRYKIGILLAASLDMMLSNKKRR